MAETVSNTWLKHTSIDGGSQIYILGRTGNFTFDNFVDDPQEPSKDVGSPYTFRLAKNNYVGHSNPKWTIEGFCQSGMDVYPTGGSVIMNFHRLGSFAMVGSPVTFYTPEMVLNPAGSALVYIKGFKWEQPVGTGRRYNLTLVEEGE